MALEALGVLGVLLARPQGRPGDIRHQLHQGARPPLQSGLERVMRAAHGLHSLDAHLLTLGAHVSWGPGEALRSRVTLEDKDQQLGQGEDTFVPLPLTRPQRCGRGSQPSPGGAAGGRQAGPGADPALTRDVPEDRHTDGPTRSTLVHLHRCAPQPLRDTSALPCSCKCVAEATRTEGLHVGTWRGREASACLRVRMLACLHLDGAAGIIRLEILARWTRARGPWTPPRPARSKSPPG